MSFNVTTDSIPTTQISDASHSSLPVIGVSTTPKNASKMVEESVGARSDKHAGDASPKLLSVSRQNIVIGSAKKRQLQNIPDEIHTEDFY